MLNTVLTFFNHRTSAEQILILIVAGIVIFALGVAIGRVAHVLLN